MSCVSTTTAYAPFIEMMLSSNSAVEVGSSEAASSSIRMTSGSTASARDAETLLLAEQMRLGSRAISTEWERNVNYCRRHGFTVLPADGAPR
jgi:hypothetical protein